MLMKYESDDGLEEEWIWNSRDGITPFMVRSRLTGQWLRHLNWKLDEFRPDYEPPPGSRVFAGLPETPAFAYIPEEQS